MLVKLAETDELKLRELNEGMADAGPEAAGPGISRRAT
jgi:hypothetical protein